MTLIPYNFDINLNIDAHKRSSNWRIEPSQIVNKAIVPKPNQLMRSNLLKNALEAGRKYIATGAISADMLRQEIYRAWERSHLEGANPRTLQADKLSTLDTERLLERQSFLIDAARPYLRVLSQAAGQERHAVMLSEQNAIVLDVVGDEQSVHGPEAVPGPGSLLSEGVAGANGLGTPLAENGYAEIIASEHFIQGFHPFTCQGIPLRNDKKEVMGVLSISVRRPEVGQRLKEILLCASHGIEAELLQKRLEEDVRRVLASQPDDGQALEQLHQDIVQAHHAGRLRLEVVSRLVAGNRFEYALQLLRQAEESIQLFRRRAALWRDLASLEVGAIQPISLTDIVRDLVDLLSTEATIRKIEIFMCFPEEVRVQADPRSLSRRLFREFIQAFDLVGKGGAVRIEIHKIAHASSGQVSLIPMPAPERVQSAPIPFTMTLPIGNYNP
ncbi:sigma-54-dependent Fis family transcriptional regulator [Aerosakkonema funiforme]|uniref:sigma-54-dependent Fis family transcriptional regulator n=1 Tax=Aerosakkonema funiforme TaxID=1246630 RepID=UPI0035B80E73